MDRFLFDEWPPFRPQVLVCYQIDRTAEQAFEREQYAEITFRGRQTVERDQDIDIAVPARRVARCGAEQGDLFDRQPVWVGLAQ